MAVPAADAAREPAWTCRVWAREARRRMHAAGFVDCPDVDAMEDEMWGYGQEAARRVEERRWDGATLYVARNSRRVPV
jgi:hypothetical protein